MKKRFLAVVGAALAVALLGVPLYGCSGQSGSDSASPQGYGFDVSSIKTLADALQYGGNTTSGWDSNYFVCVTEIEETPVRLVAEFSEDLDKKLSDADLGTDEDNENMIKVVGDLVPVSVEDLSVDMPTQEELDAFVGKTGQDILDDGYTFVYYGMYGGDTTSATYAKGYYNVDFEFNVEVKEKDSDDEGKSVLNQEVQSASYSGPSDAATDPTLVGEFAE